MALKTKAFNISPNKFTLFLHFRYLKDWKERACLSKEDLQVLFSNIQEVYDFNFELLQNLVRAGMDPVQIAKCFIDMKDRFNAYTTYW